MQLISKSGELFVEESSMYTILGLLVNLLGILAGAIVSILVFQNGLKAEKKKELSRLIELDQYVFHMIVLLDEPIKKQIREIRHFSRKLKLEIEEHYGMEKIVTVHLNYLKDIAHSDLYKIYVTNKTGTIQKRTVQFSELNTEIEYINHFQESLEDISSHFFKHYSTFRDSWNENVATISIIIDQLMQDRFRDGLRDIPTTFIDEIETVANTWRDLPNNTHMAIAMRSLIAPLRKVCQSYPMHPRSLQLITYCKNAEHAFDNMIELKSFSRTLFLKTGIRLIQSNRHLKTLMNTYKQMSTR